MFEDKLRGDLHLTPAVGLATFFAKCLMYDVLPEFLALKFTCRPF